MKPGEIYMILIYNNLNPVVFLQLLISYIWSVTKFVKRELFVQRDDNYYAYKEKLYIFNVI